MQAAGSESSGTFLPRTPPLLPRAPEAGSPSHLLGVGRRVPLDEVLQLRQVAGQLVVVPARHGGCRWTPGRVLGKRRPPSVTAESPPQLRRVFPRGTGSSTWDTRPAGPSYGRLGGSNLPALLGNALLRSARCRPLLLGNRYYCHQMFLTRSES